MPNKQIKPLPDGTPYESQKDEVQETVENAQHGVTKSDICSQTGISHAVATNRLKELVEEDAIEKIERPGRYGNLYLKKNG